MDAWTKWFLEQLAARNWTSDELQRNSTLSSTMISRYRRGRAIPKRAEQIGKIVEVFGEAGPLPPRGREIESDRLAVVEAALAELREQVAVIERAVGRARIAKAHAERAGEVERQVRERARRAAGEEVG